MIDWSKCKTIDSNYDLADIEHHFKVFAGPGAGKTYWLANHIKNVLKKSKRLGAIGKVACITYTNNGVEEIQSRLKQSAERVEVATIHSFLYSNIVKPYSFLLKDDQGKNILNIKQLDGHIEHFPSPKFINDWKRDNKLGYLRDNRKVYECLINLDWCFKDEDLVCLPRKIYKLKCGRYWIKKESLNSYKQYYWNIGQIHHEDVLYFSYILIKNYPELLDFIRSKFPYIFVDEFQDTNPIQTCIIKKIAENNTIVGVIGDLAQSIYGFQGACRKDFESFVLDNIVDFKMENNRRSTENIIRLLNHIRGNEIKQKSVDGKTGKSVKLLVGPIHDSITKVKSETNEIPIILVRKNDYAGRIRSDSEEKIGELWDEFRSIDSNWERTNLVYTIILGVELALQKEFKESITGIERNFRKYGNGSFISKSTKRQVAINCLQSALNDWDALKESTLLEFNNKFVKYLNDEYDIKVGATISRGKIKIFAESCKCKELSQCLKLKDDRSNVRTIHKAKGGEYETVIVTFEDEKDLDYIITPDIDHDDDECRIYYVALSRAKTNLYISVPTLNDQKKEAILDIGISIESDG
jgi:DNA helicase II / ATP-dependent DNA helicase PcrA